MTPKHDEIIKQLGDGWSMAWDTTEIDEETRRAINRVIAEMTGDLREILAEAFRDAKIDISTGDQMTTTGTTMTGTTRRTGGKAARARRSRRSADA